VKWQPTPIAQGQFLLSACPFQVAGFYEGQAVTVEHETDDGGMHEVSRSARMPMTRSFRRRAFA